MLRKLWGIDAVRARIAMAGLATVALIVFAAGCGTTGEESSNSDPGENASSGNTPHVGPTGTVEVDTLRWKLKKAKTSKTIGDQQYGSARRPTGST